MKISELEKELHHTINWETIKKEGGQKYLMPERKKVVPFIGGPMERIIRAQTFWLVNDLDFSSKTIN
jgi:hypothetical protein